MSLDNIQLQPTVLQNLYKNSLIDMDNININPLIQDSNTIAFLGKNKKHIAIIVNDNAALYLVDDSLNFLMGILNACKLNMEDVALLNFATSGAIVYKDLQTQLHCEKVLLFGVDINLLNLPLQFPDYQVQKYNSQIYLSAPALNIIENNKAEKTKLWNSLKTIFL